ncbi:MAG: PP0621 family protein [Burkholderiaceae bacterium]|jgi:uncharacterized protein
MKYLLVIAVLAVAFWVWRNNRKNVKAGSKKTPPVDPGNGTALQPQAMLQCAVCGVHLPAADAVVGSKGSYCSSAHRKQLEA